MGKEASPDRSCRTSGGGPAGGFRPRRRFGSCSKGCRQRYASVHGVVQNLFRVGRHLLRAAHHRLLRARSFRQWDEVTCAC